MFGTIHLENKGWCCRMLFSRAFFVAGAFGNTSVRLCRNAAISA